MAGTLHQALTLSANWHREWPAAGPGNGSDSIDGWIPVSEKLRSDKRACAVDLLPRPQRVVDIIMYVFVLICSKHFENVTRAALFFVPFSASSEQ